MNIYHPSKFSNSVAVPSDLCLVNVCIRVVDFI